MLVFVDLQRLFVGLSAKKVKLDYKGLYRFLQSEADEDEELEAVAFGMEPPGGPARQRRFFERLSENGFMVRTWPKGENFTLEMAVTAAVSSDEKVMFVTDDIKITEVCDILARSGVSCSVAFFADQLTQEWVPRIVSKDRSFDFIDMGTRGVLKQILLVHKKS